MIREEISDRIKKRIDAIKKECSEAEQRAELLIWFGSELP